MGQLDVGRALREMDAAVEEADERIRNLLDLGEHIDSTHIVQEVAEKHQINARTLHRHTREVDGAIALPNSLRKLSNTQELLLSSTLLTMARLKRAVCKSEVPSLVSDAFEVKSLAVVGGLFPRSLAEGVTREEGQGREA